MSCCNDTLAQFAQNQGDTPAFASLFLEVSINCAGTFQYWNGATWGLVQGTLAAAPFIQSSGNIDIITYDASGALASLPAACPDATITVRLMDNLDQLVGYDSQCICPPDEYDLCTGSTGSLAQAVTSICNQLQTIIDTGQAGPWTQGGGGGAATIDCDTFFQAPLSPCDYTTVQSGSIAAELVKVFYNTNCVDGLFNAWATQLADIILRRSGCLAEQSACGDCHNGQNLLGVISLMTTKYSKMPDEYGNFWVPIRSICNPDAAPVGYFQICNTMVAPSETCCAEPKPETPCVPWQPPPPSPPSCGC